jgi:glycosyltransferase involved in cell wall biosynthesis
LKIGLVSSLLPHVRGGYRLIVDWLEPHLQAAGHQVERIYLPNGFADALTEFATYRMLDLSQSCDRIITFRPPAHALKHPNKVTWFIHHERALYDLWDSSYCPYPKTAYWEQFRSSLHQADSMALKEAKSLFCNSRVVQERLARFNALQAEVIYPPIDDSEGFRFSHLGDEIISICRIIGHKRQRLMVEAMALTKTPVRLRLAGQSGEPTYLADLQRLVRQNRLENRVTIDQRWISEGEKRYLLSVALANAYMPEDEDSYGYPTLEAAHAQKATVTTSDAGGTIEFIEHERSGLVLAPEPAALADAFDRLWLDRKLARQLGRGANDRIGELRIDWSNVVERLTA